MPEQALTVRPASKDELPLLRSLFQQLYAQQAREGMQLEVPVDGFERWSAGLAPLLGRFADVLLALDAEQAVAGFLALRIRTVPAHMGGVQVGFVSEVMVGDAWRGRGAGRTLLQAAEDWCRARGLQRMELQVTIGNQAALGFYRHLGWSEELLQLVRQLPPPQEHDSSE